MKIMIDILVHNILPIFVLVGLGFLLARNFSLDIGTLNKINFYMLLPAFTFVYLYTTFIPFDMLKVLVATIIIMALNFTVAFVVSSVRGDNPSMKNAFINSVMFYNSGNIGVPLITLIFSSAPFIIDEKTPYLSLALTAQIMVLVVQSITTNTIGFYNAGRAHMHWKESLGKILKMPTIYAIPGAFLFKLIPYDITQTPFWPALEYLKGALVPVALLILGIQISRTKFNSIRSEVFLSVLLRLVAGPLFALGIIHLLSLHGIVAQTVLISASVPTSVNTVLIAVEYDNHPDFASQTVLISTLACTVTLSLIIYLSRIMFPY
ncbi:MAG TPA: AEC family transporter [Clostridiaceae bacterium]